MILLFSWVSAIDNFQFVPQTIRGKGRLINGEKILSAITEARRHLIEARPFSGRNRSLHPHSWAFLSPKIQFDRGSKGLLRNASQQAAGDRVTHMDSRCDFW